MKLSFLKFCHKSHKGAGLCLKGLSKFRSQSHIDSSANGERIKLS